MSGHILCQLSKFLTPPQLSNVERRRLTPPCHSSRAATMSKMATTSKTATAKTDKNVQGQAAHAAHSTDSNISKSLPEQFDKWTSMLLCIVLYYSVHSVIVLFHHHGSGGSCVASGDYISAAQLMLIAHSLSRPVLV